MRSHGGPFVLCLYFREQKLAIANALLIERAFSSISARFSENYEVSLFTVARLISLTHEQICQLPRIFGPCDEFFGNIAMITA